MRIGAFILEQRPLTRISSIKQSRKRENKEACWLFRCMNGLHQKT